MDRVVEWAKELQSLAQAGLTYGKDVFDLARYRRIREIAAEMMALKTGLSMQRVTELFCADSGYQTPKVDTRGAVFRDGRILLVQEKSGRWSLPGGWCEYDMSPADNTAKEVKEEAGLDVAVEKLVAVQDRDRHNKPSYAFGIVKIFFLCRALGGAFAENDETEQADWFTLKALPPLAEEKCTAEQIAMCFDARAADWVARFD